MIIYLSELLDKKVQDKDGRNIGRVQDIGMELKGGFPQAVSLTVSYNKRGRRLVFALPWDWVDSFGAKGMELNQPVPDKKTPAGVPMGDLHLRRNLLDRQIMDIHGRKVVRVNDLRLARFDGNLRLTGVDVSGEALLRRLGLEGLSNRVRRGFGMGQQERAIAWNYIAPLEFGPPTGLKLTVTQKQLQSLHPTDIADVLEQVDQEHRNRLLGLIDNVMAAESISEVEPEKQAEVVATMSEARASRILEVMPPDEATDLLGTLPRDKAERLLNIMGVQEARVIRELLGYEKHTAGGRMTPDFIAVQGHLTREECIAVLREKAPSAETIYYVYVLDDEGRLKGVLSLRDLLIAEPGTRLDEMMMTDVISVNVDDDQEMVADLISKYNLLALPVTDDGNVLKGIVTVDDMIDVLRLESAEDISHMSGIPAEESPSLASVAGSRLPIVLISLLGGLILALTISAFQSEVSAAIALAFFLPLIIRTSQDIGFFSQTVVTEAIGGKELRMGEVTRLAVSELQAVLLLDVALSGIAAGLIFLLQRTARISLAVGSTLFAAIIVATLLGVYLPVLLQKLKLNVSYTQSRFVSMLINVVSVAAYFAFAQVFLGSVGRL